ERDDDVKAPCGHGTARLAQGRGPGEAIHVVPVASPSHLAEAVSRRLARGADALDVRRDFDRKVAFVEEKDVGAAEHSIRVRLHTREARAYIARVAQIVMGGPHEVL